MTHQGFEVEAEFRVSLNPTGESRSSAHFRGEDAKCNLLDSVTSVARASSDCALRVDLVDNVRSTSGNGGPMQVTYLRVVLQDVCPTIFKVHKGLSSPVFLDSLGQV